jgi:MFS family permease
MTVPSQKAGLRIKWLIFAILACSYVLVYFHRLCASVLAVDLMGDLNAGGSLIGLLGAAYFYPYAVMQLPAGLLSDSWGPRKTITVFFLVAFAGSILLGLAPTVTWAILGRTLVGVGVAMLFVPTLKVLAEWFKPEEFATMTGILLAMGGVGSLVATAPLVWLSNNLGWRQSFVLIGISTLILAALVGVFVRNRPGDLAASETPNPISARDQLKQLYRAMGQVLTCRYFWPVALWFFFDFAIFFSFGGLWSGPYLMHVYGMSREETGRILSMMAFGLVAGGPLLSWLSDRVFYRRKPVLILCATGMIILTGLLVFSTDIPVWGLYLFFFLITVCGNAIGAIGFTMNKELFPIPIAGTATGLVNLFPFVGGALFQPLIGHLLERGGKVADAYAVSAYQNAFMVLFVCAWIAFGAALFTRETLSQ